MGIAVLGDISTWIRPGKPGRSAAAILSPILLSAGIWIHSHEHVRQLKVVGLDFRTENNLYEGGCPVDLEFDGQIQASSASTVLTEVEYSDGSKSPQLQLDLARPETKIGQSDPTHGTIRGSKLGKAYSYLPSTFGIREGIFCC